MLIGQFKNYRRVLLLISLYVKINIKLFFYFFYLFIYIVTQYYILIKKKKPWNQNLKY